LRKYVEELADKEPDHFGTSIVFSRDEDEEANFATANGASIIYFKDGSDYVVNSLSDVPKDTYFTVDYSGFKSPDPLNTRNFPHARMSKLHAADLVDDPAATDSMFSGIGGAQLASKVSEYLDTHPEVLKSLSDNKEIVEILSKYPDQIKPFIDRFTANRKEQTPMSTEATPTAETVPEATPKTDVAPLATEDATSTAETVPTEETKPKEEAPPPVGDTEQKPSLSREEFKTIAEKFGNDIAARYMLEKGDYQTALSWHVEAIEKQNAELKDQLGKFTASPSTGKPVAMTAAGKKSTLLAMCEKGTKGKV
jgi:hypothetical protein